MRSMDTDKLWEKVDSINYYDFLVYNDVRRFIADLGYITEYITYWGDLPEWPQPQKGD